MIDRIIVTNPKDETLILSLRNPDDAGLYVQEIDGLGPSKANINTSELATVDGSLYSSSRMTERNIVLTLGMLESPTIEAARLRTYKYFPIKKQVRLLFETDARFAEVVGYVESNEPVIFSNRQTTQISILCPDPAFYEAGESQTVFSGIRPMFEFPFSNESLEEDLIEFGQILLDTRAILTYNGDIDTGVIITINATGAANDINIFNTMTYEKMIIDTNRIVALTGQGFGQGDAIIISTIRGNRYARLLREGVYTNIISALDKNSDWFQISSGDNLFAFTAAGGESSLMINFVYRNAYGGI